MSHFSLMVVTPTRPTEEMLGPILQPWHQFECTGVDDQYVVEVDETDEYRTKWQTETQTRLRDPEDNLYRPSDDRFYRDPTPEEAPKVGMGMGWGHGLAWISKDWGDGLGYRAKVQFIPEGWTEAEIPNRNLMTFREFVADYTGRPVLEADQEPDMSDAPGSARYGYIRLDRHGDVAKVINRTNPNYKWDWWQIGGGWKDHFRTLGGRRVDQVQKSNWDFAGQMEEVGQKASDKYDRVTALIGGRSFRSWRDVLKDESIGDIDARRAFYGDQEAVKAVRGSGVLNAIFGSADEFLVSREQYVAATQWSHVGAFAMVIDGKWYEKGEMLMFGAVAGEDDDWHKKALWHLRQIPDDHWLTIVDCHV